MFKAIRKTIGMLLSMALIVTIMPNKMTLIKAEEIQETTTYLSDLDWYSATHGDADTDKSVQKNHPFTPGNNGTDTLISLLMQDGTVRTFDKGLGTVASDPSNIVYNITGAKVNTFSCYVGLDRSSNHQDSNHAKVEKIEIVVDESVIYTSLDDYPNGITYEDTAIELNLSVPQGAEKFELKSYSGEHTWGDEIVFADAAFHASGSFPNPDAWNTYYELSDLEWVSATHGDADTSKSVQKNHPFTPGNNGEETKISLALENGETKTFDKGLGTVASNPSMITYDISGAEVTNFQAYLGIDLSANHQDANHALIEKIEIVVDDEIIYSTINDYPNGITYETKAIFVDLDIQSDSSTFQLKSYAGAHTWGDEVVFADAKFIANGNFNNPNQWTPAEKRRVVSNESPMMMIPLYANGEKYVQAEREYAFWGDDTLTGKWDEIPEDLKPYSVIELHPDDLPKEEGSAADFYEHCLEEAQNHVNPETNELEPIPIVLTVYTAGNQSYYTAAHWLTADWIEQMYTEYTCLQGLFCTENYWVWASGIENAAAQYLTISAKHGGYFIWSEQNENAAIEKALGSNGQVAFKEAVQQYSDYFIFMFKNTPEGSGNDAPTSSYMKGLWLTDYVDQWGGLMDTWKWYETGKWKLFESSSIGKTQGNRQWLSEPEALVGIEAMSIYLNGGCVYNFEHPAYTYGVQNQQSPLYTNVIQEFFRGIIANPAPSKTEVLNQTKAMIQGNYSQMGNGTFFVGLNTEMAQSPTYTTGRYAIIPAVPANMSTDNLVSQHSNIEILSQNDSRLSSLQARKSYFNSVYENAYEGDIFAQKVSNSWYLYNYKYNENVNQSIQDVELSLANDYSVNMSATLEPHSYMILEDKENGIGVKLNNFRTNKDELWQGAQSAAEASVLPEMSKKDALSWVYTNYINNTQDQERRTTTIQLDELSSEPIISNISGLENHYSQPTISYDATQETAEITIVSNGYVYFDILSE